MTTSPAWKRSPSSVVTSPGLTVATLRPVCRLPGARRAASWAGMAPMPFRGMAASPAENICQTKLAMRREVERVGSKKTPPRKGRKKRSTILGEKP